MNILQKAIRGAKDVALRRSETEILVRDATSNEASGPNGSDMRQIADLTYSPTDYNEIMTTLWERLEDDGRNWRHVYKGLLVIDYLIKNGSERVVQECKFRSLAIKTLSEFQFIDDDEKDQGLSVRQRAKAIMELLNDEKRLNAERETASKNRDRFGQSISSESGYQQSRVYARGSARGFGNGGGGYGQGSHDRYSSPGGGSSSSTGYGGGSTAGSRRTAQEDSSSGSEPEEDPAPKPRKSKRSAAAAPAKATAAAPQSDLLGFDAFAPNGNGNNDLFNPRGSSTNQPQFFPSTGASTANRNQIDFFTPSTSAATQPQQPQQQQAPPVQQQLPGNPQRLPNGNLLVQGHEISVQQYQAYLEYVQKQTQGQQHQQPQQTQQLPQTQQPFQQPQQPFLSQPPQQTQQRPSAAASDDWNDFTGASKPTSSFGTSPLTPSVNGATSPTSPQAQQPLKPRDKFDDLLDISSLSVGGTHSPSAQKSQEPTLAQIQAQRQAQAAQQGSFGYGQPTNGFGQPQFAQPANNNNGFFF